MTDRRRKAPAETPAPWTRPRWSSSQYGPQSLGRCRATGKVAYATRKAARAAARAYHPGECLRAYRCPVADHFHIGHTPDWRRHGEAPAPPRGAPARAAHDEGPATPGRPSNPHTREHNMNNTPTLPALTIDDLDHIEPGHPTAAVVTVTVEVAKALLRRNPSNRKTRQRAVDAYARDMTAGNWSLNGESIKIDDRGNLLDGQHRLLAVIAAGIPVRMFVVLGIDPDAQETMDAGRRRTAGDAFGLRGEANATTLAAVLRRVWQWDHGNRRLSGAINATTAECVQLLKEHPEIRRSADIAVRVRSHFPHIPQSVLGLGHVLFTRLDPEQAPWFFERLADGAELPVGHPILALRSRVTSERVEGVRMDESRHLAYLIRTWNAVREGRQLARVTYKTGAPIPDPQ